MLLWHCPGMVYFFVPIDTLQRYLRRHLRRFPIMSKAPSEGTNAGKYIYIFIPSVPISKSVLIFLVTVFNVESNR